ncbi:MAG: NAD-dependent epimerase/dehydratase family protein [Acidobacteria bacterium]|nr:NAD-dependent epimerase/dehydratase family protein [Acidobacteriota bacterium]
MKVLFIGGTGVISAASAALAIERGIELHLFNRGESARAVPDGARVIRGDIRDPAAARAALDGLEFDAVVDWIAYRPEHVEADLELFRGRAGQFVFISSASAYQTPPASLPVTESTVLANPFWQYSRDKIACEERLVKAYREEGFPITIVRPSHTYDQTMLPLKGRYTMIDRMRRGKKVIVHGDGTSLWTLTHTRDFAKGFVGLLGNSRAVGEAFQITSDEALTWNRIYELAAQAAGAAAEIVHIPSATLARYDPEWGAELFGDKAHSMIFDNTKIKRLVPDFAATTPFSHGIREIVAWHDADPARRVVDERLDSLMDRIIADWERIFP